MKIISIGLLCLLSQAVIAADHEAALKDYLTDDVVAVAYLDLTSLDTLGLLEWGEELGLFSAEQRGTAVKAALAAQTQFDTLADAGVNYVYLLFRVSDVSHRGPSWVVPIAEGGNANAVAATIGMWTRVVQQAGVPKFWEAAPGALLGGTTELQLEQLKSTRPAVARDLSEAWKTLGQGNAGLVLFGDSNSRRVVREMFPPLPEPFAELNGELIAEGLRWGGISLKLPPEPDAEIVVETRDELTAVTVARVITHGLALAKRALPGEPDVKDALALVFRPQVEGARVRISLDGLTGDAQLLAKLLGPPIHEARQAAWRSARMKQFKNIALAFHHYYARYKSLPAQANYDENGKALLSWRVHLLPYLDQSALYKQFHLDEPWDSEHNRPLAAVLPEIYADPDPALRKINAGGKTTYLVPVGGGTLFDGSEGTRFKEVIDGTSNTIMLVEVVPERAVIWTQPADWEVDFAEPWEGVRRKGRTRFVAMTCDGAAHYWDDHVDDEKLRALLTKAGGEVITWP